MWLWVFAFDFSVVIAPGQSRGDRERQRSDDCRNRFRR
jgi:hypothetical protein